VKSVQLLLISFIITFSLLINISSANAKPSVNIQHIKLTNNLISQFNSYQKSKVSDNLSIEYRNFSIELILTSPVARMSERTAQATVNVVNQSNQFFTSAMAFSDKLNQFIDYFSTPNNSSVNEKTVLRSKSKDINQKCNDTLNYT
jgi:hypothetical protein